MTRASAALVALLVIGCGHDVHVNPAGAGVGEFRDRVRDNYANLIVDFLPEVLPRYDAGN